MLTRTELFRAGQEGYHTYRIPALAVTPRGTALAFCEGRKHSSGDAGDIALLWRRSRDNGATWGEQQILWDDVGNTCGFYHDYDEVCPFSGSLSPDVVYAYTPGGNEEITISLCDSYYDTKVYVYENSASTLS